MECAGTFLLLSIEALIQSSFTAAQKVFPQALLRYWSPTRTSFETGKFLPLSDLPKMPRKEREILENCNFPISIFKCRKLTVHSKCVPVLPTVCCCFVPMCPSCLSPVLTVHRTFCLFSRSLFQNLVFLVNLNSEGWQLKLETTSTKHSLALTFHALDFFTFTTSLNAKWLLLLQNIKISCHPVFHLNFTTHHILIAGCSFCQCCVLTSQFKTYILKFCYEEYFQPGICLVSTAENTKEKKIFWGGCVTVSKLSFCGLILWHPVDNMWSLFLLL